MLKRNWLELARKLVDQYDMDFTVNAIAAAIDENTLAYFGEGVFISTTYPNPFPIAMSGSILGGSVGNGIGFDVNGQLVRIDTGSPTSKNFTIAASDPTNPRWDLLVIRFTQTGDTPIPKPSDPITTIDLNLHDDFELAVIEGTPSATPAYPSKGTNDIILAGLQVPANATLGSQVVVDLSIREMAQTGRAAQASFVHENIGTGDGSTTDFDLSQTPLNVASLLVCKDELGLSPSKWSIVGQTVTITPAPAVGEVIDAYYVANDPDSQNPLSGSTEVLGVGDDTTLLFNMSGKAANQGSTLVMVDGEFRSPSKWNLVQGAMVDQIQFTSGNAPATGEEVSVFYLINSATSGSGPSGSSAYAVYGSTASPLVIDPTVGVAVSNDALQLRFLKSTGGAGTVTATPQIAPGTTVGQEMKLKGTSDVDYLIFQDGNGLALNGPISLKNRQSIVLTWDGSVWEEDSRRA